MKALLPWLLSHRRWLMLALLSVPLLVLAVWALTFRTATLIFFIVIWLIHVGLGAGAGYAALRLWFLRHHPLMKWVGVYIIAFIVDALSAIVLLFVAKGVKFTWKFSTVMFISTLISNVMRAPLIFYLIRGPEPLGSSAAGEVEKSGEQPPQFSMDEFRQIVREEIERAKGSNDE